MENEEELYHTLSLWGRRFFCFTFRGDTWRDTVIEFLASGKL